MSLLQLDIITTQSVLKSILWLIKMTDFTGLPTPHAQKRAPLLSLYDNRWLQTAAARNTHPAPFSRPAQNTEEKEVVQLFFEFSNKHSFELI